MLLMLTCHTVSIDALSIGKLRLIIVSSGGYPKFVAQGLNENYLPVWLQAAGYNTYYTGKLFNTHNVDNYDKPFPNGFTGSVSRASAELKLSNMTRTSSLIHTHTNT